MSRPDVTAAAELVLRTAMSRPPTLGPGRLVCVDGPAGSGKSTLGEAVCRLASENGTTSLVHLDDLLDGWDGLPEVSRTLRTQVLDRLARGRPGRYRRYDWHLEAFAEEHEVPPVDLLVVEGVGAGASAYDMLVTTLVWVDAPAGLRLARGLDRDGEALRPEWLRWMAAEEALFARERTRDRADVLVDGTSADAPAVLV